MILFRLDYNFFFSFWPSFELVYMSIWFTEPWMVDALKYWEWPEFRSRSLSQRIGLYLNGFCFSRFYYQIEVVYHFSFYFQCEMHSIHSFNFWSSLDSKVVNKSSAYHHYLFNESKEDPIVLVSEWSIKETVKALDDHYRENRTLCTGGFCEPCDGHLRITWLTHSRINEHNTSLK